MEFEAATGDTEARSAKGVKTMTTRTRKALAAIAFSAVAAAAITGATLRGETKETSLAETCATAQWPQIPAACLDNARNIEVRYVTADPVRMSDDMELRFETAFN